MKLEILACPAFPCQAGAQDPPGTATRSTGIGDFATAKLRVLFCIEHLGSHFVFHYLRRAEGGSYGESGKDRVQSQSLSSQGGNRENDIEISQGSDRFRPRRYRGYDLLYPEGKVKIVVISDQGKEAVVGIMEAGQFFGEGCLNGHSLRIATATAMEGCLITSITKTAMTAVLRNEPKFSEMFVAYLLTRNSRVEEDLIDQLFNSSEKRLARLLLLLANFGKEGSPQPIDANFDQGTLAEMIGGPSFAIERGFAGETADRKG